MRNQGVKQVPLSEHEQRLLEQMERALHAEDPKLASTLRHGSSHSVNGRQVALGGLAFLLGLAGLLGGVIVSFVVLGVVGFLFMLGGVLLIGAAFRAPKANADFGPGAGPANSTPNAAKTSGSKPKQSGGGSFMGKMEDRWRKRREEEGY